MSSDPAGVNVTDNLMSLQSHVLSEEAKHPQAAGDFSWILSAISLAAKTIANKVRRARLDNILGTLGTENIQGETQLKLDVIANEIIMRCLGDRASEFLVTWSRFESLASDQSNEKTWSVLCKRSDLVLPC